MQFESNDDGFKLYAEEYRISNGYGLTQQGSAESFKRHSEAQESGSEISRRSSNIFEKSEADCRDDQQAWQRSNGQNQGRNFRTCRARGACEKQGERNDCSGFEQSKCAHEESDFIASGPGKNGGKSDHASSASFQGYSYQKENLQFARTSSVRDSKRQASSCERIRIEIQSIDRQEWFHRQPRNALDEPQRYPAPQTCGSELERNYRSTAPPGQCRSRLFSKSQRHSQQNFQTLHSQMWQNSASRQQKSLVQERAKPKSRYRSGDWPPQTRPSTQSIQIQRNSGRSNQSLPRMPRLES